MELNLGILTKMNLGKLMKLTGTKTAYRVFEEQTNQKILEKLDIKFKLENNKCIFDLANTDNVEKIKLFILTKLKKEYGELYQDSFKQIKDFNYFSRRTMMSDFQHLKNILSYCNLILEYKGKLEKEELDSIKKAIEFYQTFEEYKIEDLKKIISEHKKYKQAIESLKGVL